ncbi:MAG: enoyl-CoA hydratase-related protein [Geminicoccaceae bacterium]|nr:enoyl-CoA hydratase-related protein [Geminicoccaceae bacterium]
MTEAVVLSELDERGVATVRLNRPAVHNAYDDRLIDALSEAIGSFGADPRVRLLVLRANGKHFQAGADLAFLKKAGGFAPDQNLEFSRRTTEAMRALNAFARPTLALIHGACYGGGVGLVAACDIAIATESATFALTEVRWGVIPAPIVPQLCAALGVRGVRRYGITGERFDAREAHRLGLVHEVCADGDLDAAAAPVIDAVLLGAPQAIAESKALVLEHGGLEITEATVRGLSLQAAARRASAEAKEGLSSFLEKRKPAWYPD